MSLGLNLSCAGGTASESVLVQGDGTFTVATHGLVRWLSGEKSLRRKYSIVQGDNVLYYTVLHCTKLCYVLVFFFFYKLPYGILV